MKKILMSAAVCAMLLGTSCQNEEIINQAANNEFALTLDMGAGSRTMMSEDGPVWGSEESLYVVGDNGNSYGTLRMVWKSSDGKKAMFSGKITGDASKLQHMVYPVPNEDNQILMKMMYGANHNAPMLGTIVGGEVTGLGYEGGLVKLDFSPAAAGETFTAKVTDISSELIVGGYYAFNPISGTLTYHEVEGSVLEIKSVPSDGIVWLPVATDAPKGTPETITVSVTDKFGNTISETVKINKEGAAASEENSFPKMIYNESTGLAPDSEEIEIVTGEDALKIAFAEGGQYTLTEDVTLKEALTLAEGKALYLDLGGNEIIADFIGGVIYNHGTLDIKNGSINNINAGTSGNDRANGVVNFGTMTFNHVNVGSDKMGGNAVRNEGGTIIINGGKFETKNPSTGGGWGYVFYNIAGKMTINEACSEGYPNGMFSCNNGTIDVNGGTYTIKSGANTWYMALATGDGEPDGKIPAGRINLNSGTYTWNTLYCSSPVLGDVQINFEECECNWVTKVTGDAKLAQEIESAGKNKIKWIVLEEGVYGQVIKVTGGKKLTFYPMKKDAKVILAGVDHQSNATPSTLEFNNLTIDNSKQTSGWFTGTSKNIYPCVGAWGGYFTFNDCNFIVSGESTKETGVMTWWATNLMKLNFYKCTFTGLNDHKSARAMQIYGNVNMVVEGCTFNTYKDYSLKYVANEDNIATFKGNKVYNSENFVELGSSGYPGKNYTIKIENSILGEGVNNYVVANPEGQTVYVDDNKVYPKN